MKKGRPESGTARNGTGYLDVPCGMGEMRMHDQVGRQIVTVDNRFAYRWAGSPLAVGDRVLLPETYFRGRVLGTVTALGSDYDGALMDIIDKA